MLQGSQVKHNEKSGFRRLFPLSLSLQCIVSELFFSWEMCKKKSRGRELTEPLNLRVGLKSR